ncbi:sugar phosphate nucleotidyltransferase [Lutimonas halocynthiae]|uniref:sugar phosphate nucleotidyltransferase n=1 Tax=Lutimonas halocynthiae TaxID=1446477 RepID=UPI0025B2BFCD|nr:sugar phosphate nucleotidyltransferase [Lutimonas halocynthiae]MDN3641488.1 sugar phosphate nucleotidyltransferase [Lutimonas halocynthiae]
MKIIVPMAGIGSRLRPHTLTIPKPLTLIAGKPIVQRLVEDIVKVVDQKVEEISFIIGPSFPKDTEEKLMAIAEGLGAKGKVSEQEQALGTAHAIQCAKESLEGPCVVAFADTLFKADFTLDGETDGAIWVKQVDEPSAYGVVKLQDGIITDFVEKPDEFISDLAIIGIYYFKSGEILREEIQYLIDNNILDKGEFQLTNALENMKQKGLKFVPGQVSEWMDCGNKEIALDTNSKVLKFSKEAGEELVSKNVMLENSEIIEPCYIGTNVVLKNSTIGPNVSLGDDSVVENSHIVDSLIQTNTTIKNANLKEAMIGNNAYFDGEFKSISIGDYSVLK